MERQDKNMTAADAAAGVEENTTPKIKEEEAAEDESLIIRFRRPYRFDGKEYTEVDLSGLEDLRAVDMIAVNKHMQRTSPGIDVMPEMSLEYACELAAKGAKLPNEFFTGLPPREAMKVKNRVMGFLFGSD